MKKKLSIIIPHYKCVDGLVKLLRSIPDNDIIEIIIVDDASGALILKELNEKTRNIFFHSSMKIYSLKENRGAGGARNFAIEKSTGEWIIFADSDDFFLENFLSSIMKYFDSNLDIVYFPPISVSLKTNEESVRHVFYADLVLEFSKTPSIRNKNNLIYKFVAPWSKLYSSKFIKNSKILFEEIEVGNDVMFSVETGIIAENVQVSEEKIYCVTEATNNSLTTEINERKFLERLNVFIDYYTYLKENLSEEDFKNLKISGASWLLRSIQLKLGIKTTLVVWKKMMKNRVKFIPEINFGKIKKYIAYSNMEKKHIEKKGDRYG